MADQTQLLSLLFSNLDSHDFTPIQTVANYPKGDKTKKK